MFAEGTRSRDGSVGRLRSGAAVLAAQHDLPLVPVHVSGTHEVMPVGRYWMKRRPGKPPSATRSRSASARRSRRAASSTAARSWSACAAFFEQAGAKTTPAERSSELAGATAP